MGCNHHDLRARIAVGDIVDERVECWFASRHRLGPYIAGWCLCGELVRVRPTAVTTELYAPRERRST